MSPFGAKSASAALRLAALFVLPAGPALGESVMLKRVYVPGRVSYIESRLEVEQDISGLPMPPMKFSIKQLYGLMEEVESTGNGATRITLTYDRASRNVESPMMGNVEFDTDDPEYEEAAPQLGTILKPLIGMPLTMEVDKDGEFVSFSGMDAINKKISEKAVASMHWEQMKDEFTNEHGEESWGRDPLRIYANQEVKVGDTWKASASIEKDRIGTIVTNYRYKLDRVGVEDGRKIALISVEGVVSRGADTNEQAGAEERDEGNDTAEKEAKKATPEVEVSGSLAGTALYDVELGRMVKQDTKGQVDIKIALSRLIPNLPAGDELQFATFKSAFKSATLILTEEERDKQRAEARRKAELRREAEEEDDEEEEEDD